MDTEERLSRVEKKLDELAKQLRDYHEELIKHYYTKAEVDVRLSPLPGMVTEMALLKRGQQNHGDKLRALLPEQKLDKQTIILIVQSIIIVLWILASILGVKLPNVV